MSPAAVPHAAARVYGTVLASIFTAALALILPSALSGAVTAGLHVTGSGITWYAALFPIAAAGSGLGWAAAGDRHGRKPVLVAGFLLVAAGAGLALAAQSVTVLCAAQAVAGLGGGALYACSLSVAVAASITPQARGRAVAVWSAGFACGTAAGFLLAGGAAAGGGSWRTGYVPVLAVSLLAAAAAAVLAPALPGTSRRGYDWAGQGLVVPVVVAAAYGCTAGPARGWGSVPVVAAFTAAAVLLAAFIVVELRQEQEQPLLRMSLYRIPAFAAAGTAALVSNASFVATAFALSLLWGVSAHLGPWPVAAREVLMAVAMIVSWPLLSRVLGGISVRWMLAGGLLVLAGAQAWLARIPGAAPYQDVIVPMLLAGVGWAAMISCTAAAAVNSVPLSLGGMASGAVETLRVLGQTVGAAAGSAVALSAASRYLTQAFRSSPLPPPTARTVAAVSHGGGVLAVAAARLSPQVTAAASAALGRGLADTLNIASLLTVAAAVIVAVLLRDRPGHLIIDDIPDVALASSAAG